MQRYSRCVKSLSLTKKEALGHFGRHCRLEQPLLLSYAAADAVAQCLPNLNKSVVLDVNAGFGVLTRALLNSGVNRIKSLEYREPCMTYLRDIQAECLNNMEVIFCKWSSLDVAVAQSNPPVIKSYELMKGVSPQPWQEELLGYVVGVNPAPYSTHIIRYLVNISTMTGVLAWGRMELAWLCDTPSMKSITAQPGTAHFGRLSVLSQLLCNVEVSVQVPISDVLSPWSTATSKNKDPPSSYHLIRLTPKKENLFNGDDNLAEFFSDTLSQIAVHRSKPIGKVLKNLHSHGVGVINKVGIDTNKLVCQMEPEEFSKLISEMYTEVHDLS